MGRYSLVLILWWSSISFWVDGLNISGCFCASDTNTKLLLLYKRAKLISGICAKTATKHELPRWRLYRWDFLESSLEGINHSGPSGERPGLVRSATPKRPFGTLVRLSRLPFGFYA